MNEEQAPDPLCLHAIHKLTVEKYLRLYESLFGLRYTIARVTNPYGPGQPAGRTAYGVVNRLIHLALAGAALPIYGDGAQRRDYIHVDDRGRGARRPVGVGVERRPRVQRRIGGGHAHDRHGARRSSSLPAAAASSTCQWPALAARIETGDFVADVSRMRTRARMEAGHLAA